MDISKLINKKYVTAKPFDGVAKIRKLLIEHTAVVVVDDDKYIGVLTALDIIKNPHILVVDCLEYKPTVSSEYSIYQTLTLMDKLETNALAVFFENTIIGIILQKDLLRFLSQHEFEVEKELLLRTEEFEELNCSIESIVDERTKELNAINNAKDKFFAILAHDLKNPFNIILGFSDLLLMNISKFDKEKIAFQVTQISNAANQTFTLLENLLSWSLSQSNKISFDPQSVCLDQLYKIIDSEVKVAVQSKNLKINFKSNFQGEMYADINMLQTILRNLISNAIKFSYKNKQIHVNAEQNSTHVVISVIDEGTGINPEMIDYLFDISQKTTTHGTENEKGTGLGLLLCKEYVEKHGGSISVQSELGVGSNFKFSLPLINSENSTV